MEDHQEILQDADKKSAVKEENEDSMRIQDDTQSAFGDPAAKDKHMGIRDGPDPRLQFLQEFREMIIERKDRSDEKNLPVEGLSRVHTGKDPPMSFVKNPPGMQEEYYVRRFLHNTAELDADIVELIVKEGGVTKLEVLQCLTVEDLLGWRTPKVKARYIILEAVPKMLREIQELHDQDTSVPPHAMSMLHVNAPIVINSPAHDSLMILLSMRAMNILLHRLSGAIQL